MKNLLVIRDKFLLMNKFIIRANSFFSASLRQLFF